MIARIVLASLEVALVGVFLFTAAEAAILRSMGFREAPFRLGEMHHLYAGVLLVLAGWWLGVALMVAGVVLSLDDAYQHVRETWCADLRYRSPLHRLFGWTLWRFPWIRRLTRWLDERL